MHEFLTLAELAEEAGYPATASATFFTELVEDPHSVLQPYVMVEAGYPMAVGRGALADRYFFNQDAVRVRRDEVDEYIDTRARVAAAQPADDAKRYPTTFGGAPDYKAFNCGAHIAAWLADGGQILSDDIDADIHTYLMKIIESEAPE